MNDRVISAFLKLSRARFTQRSVCGSGWRPCSSSPKDKLDKLEHIERCGPSEVESQIEIRLSGREVFVLGKASPYGKDIDAKKGQAKEPARI